MHIQRRWRPALYVNKISVLHACRIVCSDQSHNDYRRPKYLEFEASVFLTLYKVEKLAKLDAQI